MSEEGNGGGTDDNGRAGAESSAPAARERRVSTGGVELCVAEFGDPASPTVLLVHGYPDSKEVWSDVAARLTGRFHVVLYDVRGHGRSSAPDPLRGGFTLEKLTDDFLAVADAVSPDRPVHLVGHDWGSVQAWEFVTVGRTQGRIASFTSMSGPSLDHLGHWFRRRAARPTPTAAAEMLGQSARSWYIYALHTPVLPELAWRGPLGKRWPKLLARQEKVAAAGYPTASLPTDAAHGAWLYRDNIRPRMRSPRDDAFAHAPVQLITPTGDAFLSERLYDDLEQWAPGLVRHTLPAKHWIPRSRPDQVATWIADFVESTEAAREGSESGAGTGAGAGVGRSQADGTVPASGSAPASSERPGPAARRRGRQGREAVYAERFGGRLVLVTGAASGIGRATALAFARAGARVVSVDRDTEGVTRTTEEALRSGATRAWGEPADVSDEQAMEKLAERVAAEYGVVDVLVNNAGIGLSGSFFETSTDDWRKVLDVNLWGVIHGCRLFGRQMAERGQGGHIVNIASASAYQPSRALPAYSTSKAAVLMLSECLRAELTEKDIGVSAVCPGFVSTSIASTARFTGVPAEEEDRLRKRTARLYGLRGYPAEKVADAILRAVVRDRATVPVTLEARGARLASRYAPGARRAIAKVEPPL